MDGRRVKARFTPVKLDTLRLENIPFIGGEFVFYQAWYIDLEDGGEYVGQDAWIEDSGRIRGWVPTEDLELRCVISERWDD